VVVLLRNIAAPSSTTSTQLEADTTGMKCAFVNNMPDSAFDATERQFLDLVDQGSGSATIEVQRYAMEGVPRGERVAKRIAEEYAPLDEIRHQPPDLLLVTGANPVEQEIEKEAFWDDLSELLIWGSENTRSMLLSCLTAHAALTVFDGIDRENLSSKCTGVFPQEADPAHPLTVGLAGEMSLPHSRWNTVDRDAVRAAGYRIALHSEAVGWSVATRTVGRSDVVLVQGHPEYEATSLLREYRRDARRYVAHERDDVPCLPFECVAPGDWPGLVELHETITGKRRDPEVVQAYPFEEVGARATRSWAQVAERLYANWLAGVTVRSG
jgi:homoserine O-succinyltransferase/O-acetyltransferase